MTCYARDGQSSRALRQYDECAAALREALGVEPDPDTEELRARIARREVV
jgi:DNA-binding SARP family transcriptional activator